jgi:predicted phosphodiesterase
MRFPEKLFQHIIVSNWTISPAIADADFDPKLAAQIGERTFLRIGERSGASVSHLAKTADAAGRSSILHLSDLHFGGDYGFRLQGEDVMLGDPRKTLTERIVADLERLGCVNKIAAIIVTGDFMTKGIWDDRSKELALAEFKALREQLSLRPEQIIAVPGNHDVVRYPDGAAVDVRENAVERQSTYQHELNFRFFVHELVGRQMKDSLNHVRRLNLTHVDLDVCVLNSCTIAATQWTEYGYVGRNGLDTIATLADQKIECQTFRFLALHHHLLPVVQVEALESKGVTLTLDASQILTAAQKAGVNVALHGHQHKPKIAVYHDLPMNGENVGAPVHVVANGSAGARRLPPGERNTYCLFHVSPTSIELLVRELRLDGVAGAQIFSGRLATEAARP